MKNTMEEEIKRWLDQAKAELKSAKNAIQYKDYYVASFLAQQAAEKALKAVLLHAGKGLVKIHNLVTLGRKADAPSKLLDRCDRLNTLYIETRYPDIGKEIPSKKFTLSMSKEDIQVAEEVVKWSKTKISK